MVQQRRAAEALDPRVAHACVPGMIERGWGRIVNIASDAGRVGSSLEAVYSGAKGGTIAFSKTLAREVTGTPKWLAIFSRKRSVGSVC